MSVARLTSWFAGAIFPNVCQICQSQNATASESYICAKCRAHPKAIRWIERPFCEKCGLDYSGAITTTFVCANCNDLDLRFEAARGAADYAGLVKEVIHRFKYDREEWFEPFLADLLIQRALPDLRDQPVDFIAPIPLHRRKHFERGFNQAERLAARLAQVTGIPLRNDLIQRIKPTDPQARLDRFKRVDNVKNAFAYAASDRLPVGSRVLLIDDVLTTGSTASSCAKELLKNGAAAVRVWTVARGGLT